MKKKLLGLCLFCMVWLCFATTVFAAEEETCPYYITVNLTENIVTVYEQDEEGNYTVPKKAFLCSAGTETPEGTFRTTDKYVWRPLFGNVYGQYATRITGHILFHSVPYLKQDKSTLEYEEYNKLGETASAGCIRLTVEDVKWIYDNCPSGTTVRMYHGEVEEPLQPETPKKIDSSDLLRRGWDPTDPDPANPWTKGELRQMTMQTPKALRVMTAYYEKGTYYLTAQDAKQMFAHLGITLILPSDVEKISDGKMSVLYQRETHFLDCYVENGQVYYKLRDLAEMVGGMVSWDSDGKKISLHYGVGDISVFRTAETESTAVPMKKASFSLG